MNIEKVEPTLTLVDDYKNGEMVPKMREIALRTIKAQRERGMPRELNAYEIGVNICVNGRHFAYLGSTVGTPRGKRVLDRKGIVSIVAQMLLKYHDLIKKPMTENDYQLFFERDGEL